MTSSGKLSRARDQGQLPGRPLRAQDRRGLTWQAAAVTGATGFVGPHLVAALARQGWTLRLLIRRWTPLPSLPGVEAEIVWGDLADEASLKRLVDGADAVVHAAGLIKARRSAEFDAVNRDGTARLSALAPDVPFLLLSSLAAREPQLSPYAASKRAAEEAIARRSGPWLAVRAPAVYGPGDRETLAYFKMAKRGFALQPDRPQARLSLIHVEDLAEALARASIGPSRQASSKSTTDIPVATAMSDMAKAAAAALGRPVRSVPIGQGLMSAIAHGELFAARCTDSDPKQSAGIVSRGLDGAGRRPARLLRPA